jgi:hypothetical protein
MYQVTSVGLLAQERAFLERLAKERGANGLSGVIRKLIRDEAERHGIEIDPFAHRSFTRKPRTEKKAA